MFSKNISLVLASLLGIIILTELLSELKLGKVVCRSYRPAHKDVSDGRPNGNDFEGKELNKDDLLFSSLNIISFLGKMHTDF